VPDRPDSDQTLCASVLIPCFDRLVLLERTLRACFAQRMPEGLGWEILVCDNHPEQLARPLVESLMAAAPVPLRYLPAPARNIARARNVGVAAALGRYVVFIDDDEAPEPGWLASYHACMERTGADAAFGPKYPVFADGAPPDWDKQARHYTTDFRVPADTPIGRTNAGSRALGAGNSCMRVATCLSGAKPFNEQLGEADGEDAELYFRLLKTGHRFVWCPDAAVKEVIPSTRSNFAYLRTRLQRGSRTSARCRMSVSDTKWLTHAMLITVGLAQVVVHGALLVLSGEFLTPNRVRHRLGIARGLGKLTYRRGYTGFIDEPALPQPRPG
jgi:glycosyltransferase involved in cell wall biosynthesis